MNSLTVIAVAITLSSHSSALFFPSKSLSVRPPQSNKRWNVSGPSAAKVSPSLKSSSACLYMSSLPFNFGQQQIARQNVLIPLLVDTSDADGQRRYNVPLPNAHLPPQLTTASLYELNVEVPLHRLVIQDRISATMMSDSSPILDEGCTYGHVVYTPVTSDGLVGSIGCASEILIGAPSAMNMDDQSSKDPEDSGPLFVLARGLFRFRVKEIVKTIPYPVAKVDEILDDSIDTDSDIDDDGDIFDTLSSKDLVKQIFQCLNKVLEETRKFEKRGQSKNSPRNVAM